MTISGNKQIKIDERRITIWNTFCDTLVTLVASAL